MASKILRVGVGVHVGYVGLAAALKHGTFSSGCQSCNPWNRQVAGEPGPEAQTRGQTTGMSQLAC